MSNQYQNETENATVTDDALEAEFFAEEAEFLAEMREYYEPGGLYEQQRDSIPRTLPSLESYERVN